MEGLGFMSVLAILMIAFSLLGLAFGVDSSDSSFDPRQPPRPVGISL